MAKLNEKADKKYCAGCDDDYYNGTGAPECWLFKAAKVVKRFRIGWWTQPTSKDVFTDVTTHNCHKESGRFAFMEALPAHLKGGTHGS